MRINVVTLFPSLFDSFLETGLLHKALEAERFTLHRVNPRDFATDKHRTVDESPYGGGSGMVLLPGPMVSAVESLPTSHRVLLTPQGALFSQAHAARYAALSSLTLICGRYEGFDERIRSVVDEEVSLGDFVLFGGEVPAMAMIEATIRLLPGALGNTNSLNEESHADGLLEYPQYTRPPSFRGMDVPDVLRSGNHAAIARFRRKEALRRTRLRRPDLLVRAPLTDFDRELIAELDQENS